MAPRPKRNLPRLEKHRYQGHAVVFWTNTLEARSRGWLTPAFHATFRELMLHAAAREQLFCPAYCLMPDHLHLVWMGMRRESDQLNAMKFLRTHLEPALGGGREWQHQPHDHVLREKERQRNAFARFCYYKLANPVRAGLVADVAAEVADDVRRRTGHEPEESATSPGESASLRRRLPDGAWPYSGAIVPGYPTLHPLEEDYWERFWKLYVRTREAEPSPAP
jgi:putative transposase